MSKKKEKPPKPDKALKKEVKKIVERWSKGELDWADFVEALEQANDKANP